MQQPAANWQDSVEYAEHTDVGLRRANNQDSLASMLAGSEGEFARRGHLFLVADGMGRHAAGELASKISADTVPLEYFKQPQATPPLALKMALEEGNRRIFARGKENPDFAGMGTTTSVMVILPQGAMVGHVGDSRVYRLRKNRIEQLSFDHSLVWELQAAAKASGQTPPSNIAKNLITRSLGHDVNVKVDLEGPFPLETGDTFLLCSDGLTGQVEDDEIGAILSCMTPAEAVHALVDMANLRGGPDNITVIVAKIRDAARLQSVSPAASSSGGGLSRVPIITWVGVGASMLLSVFAFAAGQPQLGTIAAGLSVVALAVALVQGLLFGGAKRWKPRRLGAGPHVANDLKLDDGAANRFAEIVVKLRESATQLNWTVDWAQVDKICAIGDHFRKSGDFAGTIRQSCRAVTFLMSELRKQRRDANREPVLDD